MKRCLGWICMLSGIAAASAWGSPPTGVTPTVIARGSYGPFTVKTDQPVAFEAQAKAPLDFVVRKHEYAPNSSTGWHTHPGPVFINVVQGTLTFYEYDDPTCTPKVVSAGQGYVDDGHGHIGVNRTDQPALDVSVILAPPGASFRGELPAPGPHCSF